MNDTPARRKQVDFTDYLSVGQSFMVKKGNPAAHHEHRVARGQDRLGRGRHHERRLPERPEQEAPGVGKKSITVKTFPKDTDAANALATDKVDAYFGDAPVVAYYIGKSPSVFTFGGKAVNPIPVGIATRKGDALTAAMRKAVARIYANGTMAKILAKWKMSGMALKR